MSLHVTFTAQIFSDLLFSFQNVVIPCGLKQEYLQAGVVRGALFKAGRTSRMLVHVEGPRGCFLEQIEQEENVRKSDVLFHAASARAAL